MFPKPKTLEIEVIDIHGFCPTYQLGDTFTIENGFQLISNKSVCLHALQGLVPYYIPLSHGIPPYDLGLTSKDADQSSKEAFFQCLDPERITGGGSVLFCVKVKD